MRIINEIYLASHLPEEEVQRALKYTLATHKYNLEGVHSRVLSERKGEVIPCTVAENRKG